MIEPIMYAAIGFLISMLCGLMIVPLVHNRAVRLTTRRMEAATPLSMAEIQADKDQLRAEFAMSARRLEMSVDQLKSKTTSQLAELGKKTDAINRMKIELGEKNAAIFALEAREKALKDQLRATEEEFAAKTEALRAAEQALRAGQIIRHLREFVARGESERQLENLPRLIEEASALALVGVKELGVHTDFAFDPQAAFVLASKIQVQQVLLNLMRNAVEAMQDCERRELTVSTHRLDNETIRIDVADTGPGIAPDIAAQLFQPFITTKRHGMGVGLSISRTIIESHGGRLWAEPNPGGGTIFRMTLKTFGNEDVRDAD